MQSERRGSGLRHRVDPDDTIDDSAPLRTNPWPKVRLGLLLLIISVGIAAGILLINGVILRLFGYGTYGSRSFAEYIAFVKAVAYITSSLNVLNAVLAIAGYVLCLFVPPRAAPRPLALNQAWLRPCSM
jgi:hypothetical protein